MTDSIERLSFELTASALLEQERALTRLRSGAGAVLGAASIAGSLWGTRAAGHSLDAWALLATLAFALCSASAIWALLPRDLTLWFNGDALLAAGDVRGLHDVADGYRTACDWIEPYIEVNRRTLDRLASWLTVACILLAAEVVLQTISIVK
ncbi:MAG TPA: hypothetical protein VK707_04755 [Solirubrobacteraceae bacterium]|jgi:hypothetical protein|nr:hypothetical protein [Solirubrobacteraceae bacterium]